MKDHWYTPIRLKPDNGRLLRIYLVVLHGFCGAILWRSLSDSAGMAAGVVLILHCWYHYRRFADTAGIKALSIQSTQRVILVDHQHHNRAGTLHAFRVFKGILFLRVRESGRIFSFCCWARSQDPRQWHRIVIMNQFATNSVTKNTSGIVR